MMTIQTNPRTGPAHAGLDLFFAELGQGVNAYMERRLVLREVARLEERSDSELSAMGLSRERLLDHILRRRYGRGPAGSWLRRDAAARGWG
jgi:hypothetical protein